MKRLYHFEEGVDDENKEESASQNPNEDSINRDEAQVKEEEEPDKDDGPKLGQDKRKPSLMTNVIE